jgi:hypothetical protein
MIRIVVDDQTSEQLLAARETVFVCDKAGRVLGQFVPEAVQQKPKVPDITEEELRRRLAEDTGRPLKENMADLERR